MEEIITKRYILRAPKLNDAEEIYKIWGTDKEGMAEYKEHSIYKNLIETKKLIEAAIKETENGVLFWIIEEKESNKIVGYIKIPTASEKDKKCEVAFYFLKNWRKDGTPEEVLKKVIEYVFNQKCFETIIMKFYAVYVEDTKLLDTILQKIGMKREGILRHRLINNEGQKIDEYIYSILKEEWL